MSHTSEMMENPIAKKDNVFMAIKALRSKLSFWQILNMNVGFFGLQYSFGLQQANMSPIYSYLGAQESKLPYLWLAGPITGLIVQPIIGAFSDKTTSRYGRRSPYFLFGAILCSMALFIMPHSSTVWMAASMLWILDAANNITLEPYRAFVSDKLNEDQQPVGFFMQSAFTGLGQTLSYLTPTLLIFFGVSRFAVNANNIPITTIIAFTIGSVLSIGAILYTLATTKEIPLTIEEIAKIKSEPSGFFIRVKEIINAIAHMPDAMKQMIPMMFFSWYAMFIYWIYIAKCLSISVFNASAVHSDGFRDADLLSGQLGAFYNFVAFIAAFALAWAARKMGNKLTHGLCLGAAGIGLFTLPYIHSSVLVFIPMIGMGISWSSMMGNPYIMVATSVPTQKTGIYMGIFNMFIVIPMLLQNITMPLYYKSWLGNNPENAIKLAGVLMLLAGISVSLIKLKTKINLTQPT
jgi:maltose/moltooligosaccharide transporter